ncbi:MAG: T9SS type A sorting domain-containing protein [Bacteroidota bacterium]
MSKILIFLTLYFFTSLNLVGQTTVNTNIFVSTTWSKAGSPYNIPQDIVVFEGAQLTIEPGVVVNVTNNSGIQMRGILYAVGKVNDSIVFTSTSGLWKGITFYNTSFSASNQARLEYCKGMYADKLFDMDIAYAGPYIFKNCFFYKNNVVNYDGGVGGVYFDSCIFLENYTGLSYVQFSGWAKHCSFINNFNGVDGFQNVDSCYFSGNTGVALSAYGSAKNCIVTNNNIGVKALFNAVNFTLTNNLITHNNVGLELLSFFSNLNVTSNIICNNTLYNLKNSSLNNADLSNTCWCTNDSTAIRNKIYDGYTIGSVSGLVNFMPLMDCAPVPEENTPTELIYFQSIKKDETGLLKWQISGPEAIKEYQIERSGDNIAFNNIGVVLPKDSMVGRHYVFLDSTPFNGLNFYRIKIIDLNNEYRYSDTNSLIFSIDTIQNDIIKVYPNPAQDFIYVTGNFSGVSLKISIVNQMGKNLYQSVFPNNGQQIKIPIINLERGVYFLIITDGVDMQTKKFIKV